jgi:large subunit ribosomal protein L32e
MTEPEFTGAPKAPQSEKTKVKYRQRIKTKKPSFKRQESWRYKRIRKNWRRPRGLDSKMRKLRKGWPKSVNVGYGGPRASRHLHPSGYKEVLVHNVGQLEGLHLETQAIRIAHTIGEKKRLEILTRAKEKGFHVLNPRELKEALAEEEVEETKIEEGKEEEETKAETEATGEDGKEEKEKTE